MAVRIRLKRMGKIRAPFYRIVVVDSRKKRDGKVIEEVGKYNPMTTPSLIEVNSERVQYWLGVGAQPSDAVKRMLDLTGDWAKFKGFENVESRVQYPDDQARAEAAQKALDEAQKQAEKLKAEQSAERAKLEAEKEAQKQAEAKATEEAAEATESAKSETAEEAAAEEGDKED